MGESWSSRSVAERRTKRAVYRLAIGAALIILTGCNPVDTWRDMTGASQNDPDPATTPNTQNLAAGEAADYPNLATVPPPPVRAMTAADREKLTQSLIADRVNARHSDEQLRAGFSAAAPPPAPRTADVADNPEPGETTLGAPSVQSVSPAPTVTPSVTSTSNGPSREKSASPQPSPAAAIASSTAPSLEGTTGKKPVELLPGTPTRTARAVGKVPAEPGQGLRKQGEPPEPGPMESSLEQPQARTAPQPETIQPAPPPPQLPPTPRVASTTNRLPGGLAAGGALAPHVPPPAPAATGPAGFEPPPASPELPPPATRSIETRAGKGGQKPPTASPDKPVAEIKFAADSTSLSDSERQSLERVVPLYQQNPGKVRIVGYAGAGSGAVEQLTSYRAALGRAQAVATALTKAGIPSEKIQVEAAPEGAATGDSRAEILFEH